MRPAYNVSGLMGCHGGFSTFLFNLGPISTNGVPFWTQGYSFGIGESNTDINLTLNDCSSAPAITPPDGDGPSCDQQECQQCQGMPVWSVSLPMMNLWLQDEPLGYQPAVGPRVSLGLGYKQREFHAGYNAAPDLQTFGMGKKWNFQWLSFVSPGSLSFAGSPSFNVHFPNGRVRTFAGTVTSGTNSFPIDYLTNTRLTGNTNSGFTVSYPDGSQDVYGFVQNVGGIFQKAFLTERWNTSGQKTTLIYSSANNEPVVRLQSVIDASGLSTSIYYVTSNSYSTNLISQVVDPYGRSASFVYNPQGFLTSVADVAGLSTSFIYDQNGYVTNMTTPYGTTTFQFTDDLTGANAPPYGRSVRVIQPDGSCHLYLYTNGAPGIATSYPTNQVPSTAPYSNTLDITNLDQRNCFYWGPKEYAALSTTNITSLTSNEYAKAHLRHYLISTSDPISFTVSMERLPSPDGVTEGQKIWYDYAGKTNSQYEGTQSQPLLVAQVLPDGTTRFTRTGRNSLGFTTSETSTYTSNSVVALRTNAFTYAANGTDLLTVTNALGIQISSNAYNSFHQVLTNFDALNQMTIYTYDFTQRVASTTAASGLVSTNLYGPDGFLATNSDYAVIGGSNLYYRTDSYTYMNGLVYTHTDPRGLTTTSLYDNLQRLINSSDSRGAISYVYSNLDLFQVIDRMGFTNSFTYDSLRRKKAETNALGRPTLYNYCTCGSLDSIEDAAGNFTHFYYDSAGRRTATVYADGYAITNNLNLLGQITSTVDSSGYSVTQWFNNQGLLVASSNAFGRVQSLAYDLLDRVTNNVDANGVSITNTFDALNRVLSRSYPDGGVERFSYMQGVSSPTNYMNQLNQPTFFTYDPLGRKLGETNANSESTAFTYDPAGDLLTLTDGKNQTTTWQYDSYGRVTDKFDALNTSIFHYEYDANNRLTNRVTPAKGSTLYGYDSVGNLKTIQYPLSSNISLAYDLLNRLTNMVDAVGTTHYTWDSVGQLLAENGPWPDDTVNYTYANRLRTGLAVQAPNSSPWTQSYTYDSARRFHTITSAAGTFTYAYPSSAQNLISSIQYPNGSFVTNTFDPKARLLSTILKNSGGTNLDYWAYVYNPANQRTNVTRLDGSYVAYSYDNAGQLNSASGHELGGALRKNEQFSYYYDPAANLSTRVNNALTETFNVNSLNELTTVSRSGTLTVAGTTTSAATNVIVNGTNADLYGDYTFAAAGFTLTNGINTFTAIAADALGRHDTNSAICNLPSTISFAYDANGNMRTNGNQVLAYDDENELTSVTVSNAWRSEFVYDGKFRRRIRREYSWNVTPGTWNLTQAVYYVYDGNLPVQERDANSLPATSITRGPDLSGSLQGAGGIGGLLSRTDHHLLMIGGSAAHAYYHADGNGNITALTDTNQFIAARYVYTPFGETLSRSGPLAEANLCRFSSMENHPGSGLTLYPYRAYAAVSQKWTTSDPVDELGFEILRGVRTPALAPGSNRYQFSYNDPPNRVDPFGLLTPEEIAILQAEAKGTSQLIAQKQAQLQDLAHQIEFYRDAANAAAKAGWDIRGVCTTIYNSLRADFANAIAELRQLQDQLQRIQNLLAGAGAAATATAAGAFGAAFSTSSGGAVLAGGAGANAAVVGWGAVGVAGAAGYGAGLVINTIPNPFTGQSIGQGVQDTFRYLFFTKGW
ncbi:MAG: hypothetical protein C5B50_15740 [Verrucomicrobia bacterium]|nr:MAG: hypothetical protein C5B50_15740 [Verrucomicrobiota bacterium]